MADTVKARISLNDNSIELEGNETFVSKYLDEFNRNFLTNKTKNEKNKESKENSLKVGTDDIVSKIDRKTKKKPKSFDLEEFDISESGNNPSLENFIKQKNPGKSAGNVILVIAYYIQKIKNQPYFTEGNIDLPAKTNI